MFANLHNERAFVTVPKTQINFKLGKLYKFLKIFVYIKLTKISRGRRENTVDLDNNEIGSKETSTIANDFLRTFLLFCSTIQNVLKTEK